MVGSHIEVRVPRKDGGCCVQFIYDSFHLDQTRSRLRGSGSSVLAGLQALPVTPPRPVLCGFSSRESSSQSLNPFYLENGILKVLTLWGFCEH